MGGEYLRFKVRPGREAKRVARRQLKRLTERFAVTGGSETLVHDTRTGMKKLRALLCLLRSGLSREAFARYQYECKAIADLLAVARDVQVMQHTLSGLLEADCDSARRDRLLAPLRRGSMTHGGERALYTAAQSALRGAHRESSRWNLKACDHRVLRRGLCVSYREGRKDWKRACMQPDEHNLHRWRKKVKRFYYQLTLIFPQRMKKQRARLRRLGESLGLLNDLALLERFLHQHRQMFWVEDIEYLHIKMLRRRERLLARVWSLARRAYRPDAASYTKRLVGCWSAAD